MCNPALSVLILPPLPLAVGKASIGDGVANSENLSLFFISEFSCYYI